MTGIAGEIAVALDALGEDRHARIREFTYDRGRVEVVLEDGSHLAFRHGRWVDAWLTQYEI